MRNERSEYSQRTPIVEIRNSVVVTPSMIDSYGNHLNHALALRIFEDERMRTLEMHGIAPYEMGETFGVLAFVHDLRVKYNGQAFEGESLDVVSGLYVNPASMVFHHELNRNEQNVIDAVVTLAIVNKNGRPTRVPKDLLEHFKSPNS